MSDEGNYRGHDPREPLFPNYRDFRRSWWAPFVALLLWYALPLALIGWLACLSWWHPVSPAPLFFAWAVLIFVGTFGSRNDAKP